MKLSFSPADDDIGNVVISPEDPVDGELYFALIGAGSNTQQNELAAKIVERFNAFELDE